MANVTFTTEFGDLRRALSEEQQRIANQYPLWQECGEIAYNSVVGNFDAGGRPTKWKALSEATFLSYHRGSAYTKKDKKGKDRERASFSRLKAGHKILMKSGRLIRSLVKKAFSDHAEVGSNVEYAAIHHFGGTTKPHKIKPINGKYLFWNTREGLAVAKEVNHPGSKIPARPYLLIDDADQTKIKDAVEKYLAAPFQGGG